MEKSSENGSLHEIRTQRKCSTLFVLICHVLIDVTRCSSSCRGYKYVKNDLAGGSSNRGFELPRAKLFKLSTGIQP